MRPAACIIFISSFMSARSYLCLPLRHRQRVAQLPELRRLRGQLGLRWWKELKQSARSGAKGSTE